MDTRRVIAGEAADKASSVLESPKSTTGKAATSKGAEAQALIEMGLVGLFGSIAVATGHPHWAKDASQVLPISAPLVRMWNELPKKTRENLEKKANPLLFVAGCCVVVGPDIATEVQLRRQDAGERKAASRHPIVQVTRNGLREQPQPGSQNDKTVAAPPSDAFVSPI